MKSAALTVHEHKGVGTVEWVGEGAWGPPPLNDYLIIIAAKYYKYFRSNVYQLTRGI
jgi:hypothetical protein